MSAMARLPPRAPGSAADDAPPRWAARAPRSAAARGAHRHGSNAPSARLQHIMHRVGRGSAFLNTAGGGPARDAGSASADAAAGSSRKAWGRPLPCWWARAALKRPVPLGVRLRGRRRRVVRGRGVRARKDLHLERGRSARDALGKVRPRVAPARRGRAGARRGFVMDGRAARAEFARRLARLRVPPGTRWRSRPRSRRGSSGGGWSSGRSSPSDASRRAASARTDRVDAATETTGSVYVAERQCLTCVLMTSAARVREHLRPFRAHRY